MCVFPKVPACTFSRIRQNSSLLQRPPECWPHLSVTKILGELGQASKAPRAPKAFQTLLRPSGPSYFMLFTSRQQTKGTLTNPKDNSSIRQQTSTDNMIRDSITRLQHRFLIKELLLLLLGLGSLWLLLNLFNIALAHDHYHHLQSCCWGEAGCDEEEGRGLLTDLVKDLCQLGTGFSGQTITHQISHKIKLVGKCHWKSIGQFL